MSAERTDGGVTRRCLCQSRIGEDTGGVIKHLKWETKRQCVCAQCR